MQAGHKTHEQNVEVEAVGQNEKHKLFLVLDVCCIL